ncbi:cytochrome c oxidase subunit 2A [Oceanobacillus jeddahense]|uniref:Cytochrome c oxidase subunit 2A n=1 Tax=Oceanobacillus jeddahense TaxID=1462527 RepID=A0ABY5JL23_9BACI|nr:cytochrome c oxidase subunit 2A [Oceanobacillus jeddahense]UUI01004.1 cytochrome c oxidase subunit 2A [Oceanobacillus jeddahense]
MKKPEPNLKGTFFSVITIGVIILISWFAVFLLFLSR